MGATRPVAVSALVALVLGATIALPPAATAGETDRPAKWDPRVRALVRFVEREREHEFDHPIDVEFLDDASFVEALSADATDEDLRYDELYSGDLYALGLAGPDFDLTTTVDELDATGVYGFYDEETEDLKVRGEATDDVVVRATVVHELTHALQDQMFDMGAMWERTTTSGQDSALSALIEGDATWIEEAYVATRPRSEQDRYDESFGVSTEVGATEYDGGALAVDLLLSVPYTLGYAYVDYLRFTGGTAAVDRAFRHPPPSDEQIIDPVSLVRRERPDPPAAPRLRAGEQRRGPVDELGVVQLFVALAARIPPADALAAVTGWDGDRYRGYTRDGAVCLRATIATDDRPEATELAAALEDWAGPDPGDAVTVRRRGAEVHLDACGVADAALPSEDVLGAAADALATRFLVYGSTEEVSSTLRPEEVRCLTDLQVTDPEVLDLLFADALAPQEQRRLDRTIDGFAAECGLVPAG